MSDYSDIINALNLAFYKADCEDWQGYADLCKYTSVVFRHGGRDYALKGTEEIMQERRAYLAGLPKGVKVMHKHLVTNFIVAINENALEATSQCYGTAFRRINKEPPQLVAHSIYHDRLRKIDGQWWLTERRVEVVWSIELND